MKGLELMIITQRRRMRKYLICIKQYNLKNNPWVNKSIKFLALNSPLNYQNSFWRIKNYHNSLNKIKKFSNTFSKSFKKIAFHKIKET